MTKLQFKLTKNYTICTFDMYKWFLRYVTSFGSHTRLTVEVFELKNTKSDKNKKIGGVCLLYRRI